jgi:hypothetical protein
MIDWTNAQGSNNTKFITLSYYTQLTNALRSIRHSIEPSIMSNSIRVNSVNKTNALRFIICLIKPLIVPSSINHLTVSQSIRLMH